MKEIKITLNFTNMKYPAQLHKELKRSLSFRNITAKTGTLFGTAWTVGTMTTRM